MSFHLCNQKSNTAHETVLKAIQNVARVFKIKQLVGIPDARAWQLIPPHSLRPGTVLYDWSRTSSMSRMPTPSPNVMSTISAAVFLPRAIWSLASCVPSLTSWQEEPCRHHQDCANYCSDMYKGWPSENENFSCCQLFEELFGQSRRKFRTVAEDKDLVPQ
jgi:hypothetical protein